MKQLLTSTLAAIALTGALSTIAVAETNFTILDGIPAEAMTTEDMAAVEGKWSPIISTAADNARRTAAFVWSHTWLNGVLVMSDAREFVNLSDLTDQDPRRSQPARDARLQYLDQWHKNYRRVNSQPKPPSILNFEIPDANAGA